MECQKWKANSFSYILLETTCRVSLVTCSICPPLLRQVPKMQLFERIACFSSNNFVHKEHWKSFRGNFFYLNKQSRTTVTSRTLISAPALMSNKSIQRNKVAVLVHEAHPQLAKYFVDRNVSEQWQSRCLKPLKGSRHPNIHWEIQMSHG